MFIPAHERRIMRRNSETLIHTASSITPFDLLHDYDITHPTDSYSENELEAMSHSVLAKLTTLSVTTIRKRREVNGLCARDAATRKTLTSPSYYHALSTKHGISYHKLMASRRKHPTLSLTTIIENIKTGEK